MAAALPEELREQVLLRFPPDDPASLVRAALVSKRWCRLIAGRGFRRRFRELHRAAPMLGFICNKFLGTSCLVPTSSCVPPTCLSRWRALDSRDGHVLLFRNLIINYGGSSRDMEPLVVWNPITGKHLELPSLPEERCSPPPFSFNGTLLCAGGDACDHLDDDCHYGRFLVIFAGTYCDGLFTYVYSSDAGTWSEPSITEVPKDRLSDLVAAALLGNEIYFVLQSMRILKYDLSTRESSIIDMPPATDGHVILMTTEHGKLGLATADDDFKLYLWSREVGPQGDALWTQDRVIELQNLLPEDAQWIRPEVAACVHGRGIVLVVSSGDAPVLFVIDPKLNQATKVEGIQPFNVDDDVEFKWLHYFFDAVVPYTSFYFPALGAVPFVEEPSARASSAS